MISVVRPDHTVAVHKGPCILCSSADCPGDPCCGDMGGKCVVAWDGEAIGCLASYPPGISYSDCSCDESPCEHNTALIAQTMPAETTVDHRKEALEKAKAAYEERMHHHGG